MHRREYRSNEERVGAAVLSPVKGLAVIVMAALVIIAYLPVTLLLLLRAFSKEGRRGGGSLRERISGAFKWPLAVLGINEFLSLGGFDIPLLSSISEWLEDRAAKRHG